MLNVKLRPKFIGFKINLHKSNVVEISLNQPESLLSFTFKTCLVQLQCRFEPAGKSFVTQCIDMVYRSERDEKVSSFLSVSTQPRSAVSATFEFDKILSHKVHFK